MYDEYFEEFEPVKRKEILDGLEPEEGGEERLGQMRTLFALRYTPARKNGYNDEFVKALMTLRIIAYNPGGKRKNTRQIEEAVHALCLDRTDEFPYETLYPELCHLMAFYISSCLNDSQYGSVIFSMGRMREGKLIDKIKKDLSLMWKQIPEYLGDEEHYRIFKNAMDDTMNLLMTRKKTSWF